MEYTSFFLTKSYLALYVPRKYCYLVSVSPSEYVHLYYPTPAFTLHELACSTCCSIGTAIRVASVIAFSVCFLSICQQYNIWPPHHEHAMYVMLILH